MPLSVLWRIVLWMRCPNARCPASFLWSFGWCGVDSRSKSATSVTSCRPRAARTPRVRVVAIVSIPMIPLSYPVASQL